MSIDGTKSFSTLLLPKKCLSGIEGSPYLNCAIASISSKSGTLHYSTPYFVSLITLLVMVAAEPWPGMVHGLPRKTEGLEGGTNGKIGSQFTFPERD